MKFKLQKNTIIYLLIALIVILSLVFLLFDIKNVEIQSNLHNMQNRLMELKKQFPTVINPEHNMVQDGEVIYIENVFISEYHDMISKQFDDLSMHPSNNLGLRKASAVNFMDLHKSNDYIGCLETYYNHEVIEFISSKIKKPIQRTNSSDINSCGLLIYSEEGDHIYWHIDNSIYYGDRYVVLYTITNDNPTKNGLSQNEFYYRLNGTEHKLKMKPNSLVIFKGSDVWHKSTAIGKDEKRVLLSMTFCDICQEKKNILNYVHDKIKNLVTYG